MAELEEEEARARRRAQVRAWAHGRRKPYKPPVKFTAELARTIVRRVALGEAVTAICAEPGMPTHGTVSAWARRRQGFGKSLKRAKEAAGWTTPAHPGPDYCEAQAVEIYARLCEGESLRSICNDPAMPGHSTVHRWRQRFPEFEMTLRAAREVQAEMFVDEGMDILRAVTPDNAYAAHVQLSHLRWTAGVQAPRRYGRFKPVPWEGEPEEEEAPAAEPQQVVFRVRHFEKALGEDGKAYLREVMPAPEGMKTRDLPADYDPMRAAGGG